MNKLQYISGYFGLYNDGQQKEVVTRQRAVLIQRESPL